MSSIKKSRRRLKPTKRLDMSDLYRTLEEAGFTRGFLSCLGIVQAADDGGPHFDLDGEDLLVEVELMPSRVKLTTRVGTVAGGGGGGVWKVPPIGAEVLVAIPDGDLDFQPTIASWYSSGNLPSDIGESTLVVSCPPGGEVYIHDGSGGVDQLVTKAAYEAHIHSTGVGPSGTADNAMNPLSYTSVLKAK